MAQDLAKALTGTKQVDGQSDEQVTVNVVPQDAKQQTTGIAGTAPVVVVAKPKFTPQFYRTPTDNYYNDNGDEIKAVGGIFVPKTQEEQDQLVYHFEAGRLTEVK